ncbi:hypothetical protein IPG41_04805 [Candidatus Peregrinibacteria bacterium]|nr:MAG: hypothetical protein IPG41_04805 [Candidatus Peregrinibacteria bacterium]
MQAPQNPQVESIEESSKRFVVIGGENFAVEDILDAVHGRQFLASLHPADLAEIQNAIVDPFRMKIHQIDHDSIRITREDKTRKIQGLVAQCTDGLRDNLPNRATILAALDRPNALPFSNMTEFLARFAELSEDGAAYVRDAAREVADLSEGVLNSSASLYDPRFVDPTVQAILGDGMSGGEWAEVNTVILERALLGQTFTHDDFLQLWIADGSRSSEVIRSNYGTRSNRYDAFLGNMMLVGGASTLSIFPLALSGNPYLVLIPFLATSVCVGSLFANAAMQRLPNSWVTRAALTANRITSIASTIPGFGRMTSTDLEKRARPHIKKYEELFSLCQQRIEEMQRTGFGRFGLFIVREIIGQESGALAEDTENLDIFKQWHQYLHRNADIRRAFDEFSKRRAHGDFDKGSSVSALLKDFGLYLEAPSRLEQELGGRIEGRVNARQSN